MYIISIRKNFDDPDKGATDHLIRDVDVKFKYESKQWIENGYKSIEKKDLKKELKDKNVLMLVHGYKNKKDQVYNSYKIIEENIKKFVPDTYDHVIGYSWPGGNSLNEFDKAEEYIGKSGGSQFAGVIKKLSEVVLNLDIMSHSLGAMITLEALNKCSGRKGIIRNYYCTAGAVKNSCFRKKEKYRKAKSLCERIFVFHSKCDRAMWGYLVEDMNRLGQLFKKIFLKKSSDDFTFIKCALGYNGARKIKEFKNIFNVDGKKIIKKHGGYKNSKKVYEYIREYQNKNPKKKERL